MLRRKKALPAVPAFAHPFPSHINKSVQAMINRVAYLMARTEANTRQRARLHEQEILLRELMRKCVDKNNTETAQSKTDMLSDQIEGVLDEMERLEGENTRAHDEIMEIVGKLPDEVDTYALFSSRIEIK